jgi:hypothetical protein
VYHRSTEAFEEVYEVEKQSSSQSSGRVSDGREANVTVLPEHVPTSHISVRNRKHNIHAHHHQYPRTQRPTLGLRKTCLLRPVPVASSGPKYVCRT